MLAFKASTDMAMWLSVLCQTGMKNLFTLVLEHSGTGKHKPSSALTAKQIEDARLHPSTIIGNSLLALVAAQKALKAVENRMELLEKQRTTIRDALAKLSAPSAQDKTKATSTIQVAPSAVSAITIPQLEKHLKDLKNTAGQLEEIRASINQQFKAVDEQLVKDFSTWEEHEKKYIKEFIDELKTEDK